MPFDPCPMDTEIRPDPRRWLALVVLLTGAFLPAFDFFVVNVALPSVKNQLGANPAQLEFVVTGYGLAFAILLVTGGRLGDLYGRKRLFMLGMAGFTVASGLCGLAPTPGVLVGARVLQGLTAAIMSPQVLALIRVTFPEGERAKAIGYFTSTIGFASILAQIVGGALIQADIGGTGWRPIFLVNVPIGLLALLAAWRILSESRADSRPSIDVGGIVLGTIALGLLIYPLVEGRQAGWPAWSWWMLAAAVPALGVFVAFESAIQLRGHAPLVNLRLFRDSTFSLGLTMTLTFSAGLAAFFLVLTLFLQDGFGFSALATGLIFVAFGVGFMAGSMVSAWVARRLGPRTITAGTAIQAAGLLAIVAMALTAHGQPLDPRLLMPVLVFYGCGQGLAMPTLVASVVGNNRIPAKDAGAASGVFSMLQQVAYAVGIAFFVGLFFTRLDGNSGRGAYEGALAFVLICNAALMAVTGVLALFLPRRVIGSERILHLD